MSPITETLYTAQTAQSHTAHTDPKSVPNPDDFRQVLRRVDPNNPGLPPEIATRINAPFMTLAERDPAMAARVEAAQLIHEKASPLYHKIADNIQAFSRLFDDLGIPFADSIKLSQTPDGRFHVDGWGSGGQEGVTVDHPQGPFIEAVMNGDIPELSKMSEKIQNLFSEIETWHAEIQDIRVQAGKITGDPYTPQNGFFASNVVIGANAGGVYETNGRVLSIEDPNAFDAFQEGLGDQLDMLSYDQILARFYFEQVERPKLAERYPDYFA